MIRVQDLKKFFGPKKAVNGVSFTVEKGEVLGFLPNCAECPMSTKKDCPVSAAKFDSNTFLPDFVSRL